MLFLRFITNMNEVTTTWKGSTLWENIHSICEITLQAPTAICYNTILIFIISSLWMIHSVSSVQSLSHLWLFVTLWTAGRQASLSISNSWSPLKPMSIESVMPSHPLLSPSLAAFYLSQHQSLFKWVSSSHQVAKVSEFQLQHQSFQWTLRTDFL